MYKIAQSVRWVAAVWRLGLGSTRSDNQLVLMYLSPQGARAY